MSVRQKRSLLSPLPHHQVITDYLASFSIDPKRNHLALENFTEPAFEKDGNITVDWEKELELAVKNGLCGQYLENQ